MAWERERALGIGDKMLTLLLGNFVPIFLEWSELSNPCIIHCGRALIFLFNNLNPACLSTSEGL